MVTIMGRRFFMKGMFDRKATDSKSKHQSFSGFSRARSDSRSSSTRFSIRHKRSEILTACDGESVAFSSRNSQILPDFPLPLEAFVPPEGRCKRCLWRLKRFLVRMFPVVHPQSAFTFQYVFCFCCFVHLNVEFECCDVICS